MEEVNLEVHKDIIEKCKSGDNKAQYELYSLYAKAMFNITMRMMNSQEQAEDMLQESFMHAFAKIDTFRYSSTFGAWIKRIVINKCINELKKKRVDISFTENEEVLDWLHTEEYYDNEPEYSVTQIQRCMQQLPDGYRVILSLYLMEGYDHVEISEILGISESTSKSQYHRAKKKLIEIIKTNSL